MMTKTLLKLPVNGKTVSAAVCLLGSAALLCNVGTNESSTGGFAAMRTVLSGGGGSGGRIGMSDRDRADVLLDRMLSVAEEDGERDLMSAKVLQDGYYTNLGNGVCVDSEGNPYDHVSVTKNTAAQCARLCGRNLLLREHRGFEYDDSTKDCRCLFDNHMIPRPVQKKSLLNGGLVVISPHGEKRIKGANSNIDSAINCYTKNEAMVGSPIDKYVSKQCNVDDGERLDYASFTAFEPEDCAEVCGRFSLLETHRGFTVTVEGHCRCLFKNGELPTERKLSNSGADRYDNDENGYTFTERLAQFVTPAETLCYDRKSDIFKNAGQEKRLAAAPSDIHVFINEFHFRNYDTNEPFVRVVGPEGASADDFAVISYLGRDGTVHKEETQLSGIFTSSDNDDFGSIKVDLTQMKLRKGKQGGDGLALVNTATSVCLQFLSYSSEPTFTRSFEAAEGICAGIASVPIPLGITEERDLALGNSLQLTGSGNKYDDFTWDGPFTSATSTANAGQTLTAF